MTTDARDAVLKDLGTLFDQGVFANLADGELLDRFVSRCGELSESAFAVLVERHGPMVLRVCRNVLKDPHDVEDAFQATFMILIRKAGSIRKRGSCGSWLHGVALRAAAGIRTGAARRRVHERKRALNAGDSETFQATELPDDLPGLIDQELGRLRDHHRSPLVLCYLEGHTCEEAARQLGWPVGTVKSRLARGRERLRRQLIRRGVAPSVAVAAGTELASPLKAAVPASLASRVIEEAARFVARGAVAAALTSTIATLVRTELTRGITARSVRLGLLLVGLGLVFSAAMSMPSRTEEDPTPVAAQPERPKAKGGPVHARVIDLQGKAAAGVEVVVFQWPKRVMKVKTDHDGRVVLAQTRTDESFSLMARRGNALAGMTRYETDPLKGGTAEDPFVLTLTPLTHKVDGSIVDPQGRPIAGVRVVGRNLSREGSYFTVSRQQLEQENYPLGSCVTDAQGRYTLMLPANTRITLATLHPRRIGPQIVVPEDAEGIDPVTLQPAGGITGSISDATTGTAVAGAAVYAELLDDNENLGGYEGAISDTQGRFTMDGLIAGVYHVSLWRVPWRTKVTAHAVVGIRVRTGEDASADLKVIDGIPLQGVVIDPATRRPIPDIRVTCIGPASSFQSSDMTRTDERGQFTFFVPPGEHSVGVDQPSSDRVSRLAGARVSVTENGKLAPIRLVGPLPERAPVMPATVPGKMTMEKPITKTKASPTKTKAIRVRPATPRPEAPEGRTVIGQVLDDERRPLAGVGIYYTLRVGFDIRLGSWGDGSGVPTADYNLIIVGVDERNLLHIRIFDAIGNRVTDADETTLPAAQAGAIADLKRQLRESLPRDFLKTAKFKLFPEIPLPTVKHNQILGTLSPIVGLTLNPGQGGRAIKVVSDRQGIFIVKGLPRGAVTIAPSPPQFARFTSPLAQLVPADRDTVEFKLGHLPDIDLPEQLAPVTDEPVPPSLKDRLTFVNLEPKGNEFLADGPGGGGDDLNRMPQGIHALDGVFYQIGERLIHVHRPALPGLPDAVSAPRRAREPDKSASFTHAEGKYRSAPRSASTPCTIPMARPNAFRSSTVETWATGRASETARQSRRLMRGSPGLVPTTRPTGTRGPV